MNKEMAELIYYTVIDRAIHPEIDEDKMYEIFKHKDIIEIRYNHLKQTHSFADSDRIAVTEWLMCLSFKENDET